MLRWVVFVLVVAGAQAAFPGYPRWEEVVRDPNDFDLLYSSKLGTQLETWYFVGKFNLTSLIIPTQIDICGTGSGDSTYQESVELLLYQTRLASNAAQQQTTLLASGSFSGTAKFGQELEIPLRVPTSNEIPVVQVYTSSTTGYRYTLHIVFKSGGIYPWYTSRALSTYSCVYSATNVPGIAIGLTYTAFNPA